MLSHGKCTVSIGWVERIVGDKNNVAIASRLYRAAYFEIHDLILLLFYHLFFPSILVSGNDNITYVQGMNVLVAPFLFTMSEIDAFFSFATFIEMCCPLYVNSTVQGVHCGLEVSSTTVIVFV